MLAPLETIDYEIQSVEEASRLDLDLIVSHSLLSMLGSKEVFYHLGRMILNDD